jgi:hypothetical protein
MGNRPSGVLGPVLDDVSKKERVGVTQTRLSKVEMLADEVPDLLLLDSLRRARA